MKPTPQQPSPATAGFSLFEIAVAMTILGLISGAIFSILWQAGDTAVEIRELDRRDEEVSRFLALLRESIEHLPQDGTLEMVPAEETASGHPELKFGNCATAFTFGKIVGSAEEAAISLRPGRTTPEGQPTYDLALTRPDFAPEDTTGSGMALRVSADDLLQADEEGRYWMPLLTGVTAAGWSYWDEEQQIWLDEWTDRSRLPPLLAFSFDDAYRPVPLRVVFEIPEQVSNPSTEESTTATPATTGSASAGNNPEGSSGRPDGDTGRPGGGEGRPGGGEGRPGGGEGRPGNGGPGGGPTGGGNPGGGGGGNPSPGGGGGTR